MADVNSLFDCFDESAADEATVQLPDVKKEKSEPWVNLTCLMLTARIKLFLFEST